MPQLQTLGTLTLRRDGQDLLTGRRKVLALLAYLSRSAAPLPRDLLARLFWPTSPEERARHSLRQALSELKHALGEDLQVGPSTVSLSPHVDHDVAALEAAIAAGDPSGAGQLWRGEFLPGAEDLGGEEWLAWLAGERSRLGALMPAAAPSGPAARSAPPATSHPMPPSVLGAPRWAIGHEPSAVYNPTREITVGLLGTLSTEARSVLEAAALLGEVVTEAALAEVAALSGYALQSALEELSERGMLVAQDRAWAFTGSGARQRVLRMISADRRRQLHASAERVLGGTQPLPATQSGPKGGRRIMALLFGAVTLMAVLAVGLPGV